MLDLFLSCHGRSKQRVTVVSFRQKLRIFPRFLPPTEIRESINGVPDDALFQLFVVRVFENGIGESNDVFVHRKPLFVRFRHRQ